MQNVLFWGVFACFYADREETCREKGCDSQQRIWCGVPVEREDFLFIFSAQGFSYNFPKSLSKPRQTGK